MPLPSADPPLSRFGHLIHRFGFKWLRRSDQAGGREEERWIKEASRMVEVEFEQRHLSEWDSCGR